MDRQAEACGQVASLGDRLALALFKLRALIHHGRPHIRNEPVTVEITQLASLVEELAFLMNAFPVHPRLIKNTVTQGNLSCLVAAAEGTRQSLLHLLKETRLLLLGEQTPGQLVEACDSVHSQIATLQETAWNMTESGEKEPSWSCKARKLGGQLQALLELKIAHRGEEGLEIRAECGGLAEELVEDLQTLTQAHEGDEELPLSVRALLMELESGLVALGSVDLEDGETFFSHLSDLEPLTLLLTENLVDISDFTPVSSPLASPRGQEALPEANKTTKLPDNPFVPVRRPENAPDSPVRQIFRNISFRTRADAHTSEDAPITHPTSPQGGFSLIKPAGGERGRGIGAARLVTYNKLQKQKKDTTHAEKITETFLTRFSEMAGVWAILTQTDKESFLQTLAGDIELFAEPENMLTIPATASKLQKLKHMIRVRMAADLSRVPIGYAGTEQRLAQSTLEVITHSSLTATEPEEAESEAILKDSSSKLLHSLVDTLYRIPQLNDGIIRFQEEVQESLEQAGAQLDQFYTPDEYIIRAARTEGIKLISYQLRITIWQSCNSLRVQVAGLLGLLACCGNPSLVGTGLLFQVICSIRCAARCIGVLLGQVATIKHISGEIVSFSKGRSSSLAGTAKSIWEEKDPEGRFLWQIESEESIKSMQKVGSLSQLVWQLTSDRNIDHTFLKTFIATYRSFTTPFELLQRLQERFDVPKHLIGSQASQPNPIASGSCAEVLG